MKKRYKLAAASLLSVCILGLTAVSYTHLPLGYVKENPCSRVKLPKFEKKPKERYIITPEEFRIILDRFPEGSNFYLPLMIGYYTGLRISEAFALTWDDIDLEKRTLTVNKTVIKRNYGVDEMCIRDRRCCIPVSCCSLRSNCLRRRCPKCLRC